MWWRVFTSIIVYMLCSLNAVVSIGSWKRPTCAFYVIGSLDKDADGLLSVNINMNYFTDSAALQQASTPPPASLMYVH